MEFKGTRGKWLVNRMDDTFINSENGKSVLCIQHNGCYDYKELPYNALLISKAPEMLEMLKRVYDSINMQSEIEYCSDTYYEIEELIKQATEL